MMTKDMRKYMRLLERKGYTIVPTAGNSSDHVKIMWQGRFVDIGGGGTANSAIRNLKAAVARFERAEAERLQQLREQEQPPAEAQQSDLGQCEHPGCPEPAVAVLEEEGAVCYGHLLMAAAEEL